MKIYTRSLSILIYPILVLGSLTTFYQILEIIKPGIIGVYVAIANFPFLLAVVAFEYLLPFRKDWQRNRGDVLADAINTLVRFPIFMALLYAGITHFITPPLTHYWIHNAHLLVQFGVLLVISELFYYGYHRLSHELKSLWKFHAVHHGALRVYWLNSARFHLVDLTLSLLIYFIPIAVFGVHEHVVGLFIAINATTGLLEHANIDFHVGPLNYIFNTAELHRWHHSEKMEISQKNYGKVLSIWDWIFGTGYFPRQSMQEPVGIEGEIVPNDYIGQLRYPFLKKSSSR